jgi:hypothetical protein
VTTYLFALGGVIVFAVGSGPFARQAAGQ